MAPTPRSGLWRDALRQQCRAGGGIVPVAPGVATGGAADGQRELRGVDLIPTAAGAGGTACLRGRVARGLPGVQLVRSDAHRGRIEAIGAGLPGAAWQRCPTHCGGKLRARLPQAAQDRGGRLGRSIVTQPAALPGWAPQERIGAALADRFPAAAAWRAAAAPERLAGAACPGAPWPQIGSHHRHERRNRAIRRRTAVGGSVPNRAAISRLLGASRAEQPAASVIAPRSLSAESRATARPPDTPAPTAAAPRARPAAGCRRPPRCQAAPHTPLDGT